MLGSRLFFDGSLQIEYSKRLGPQKRHKLEAFEDSGY
jgi:hypothetical protein